MHKHTGVRSHQTAPTYTPRVGRQRCTCACKPDMHTSSPLHPNKSRNEPSPHKLPPPPACVLVNTPLHATPHHTLVTMSQTAQSCSRVIPQSVASYHNIWVFRRDCVARAQSAATLNRPHRCVCVAMCDNPTFPPYHTPSHTLPPTHMLANQCATKGTAHCRRDHTMYVPWDPPLLCRPQLPPPAAFGWSLGSWAAQRPLSQLRRSRLRLRVESCADCARQWLRLWSTLGST